MKYYKLTKTKNGKIIERVQSMNRGIEDYWDKVANNWIEKIEKKED